jgi:hypothetical protein
MALVEYDGEKDVYIQKDALRNNYVELRPRIDKEEEKNRLDKNNNMGDSDESQPRKSNSRKPFTPPTVDEVHDYCCERANNVDPEAFVDFYESKGWMVGKNKMKDWKAAVRTWEKEKNGTKPQAEKKGRLDWIDDIR